MRPGRTGGTGIPPIAALALAACSPTPAGTTWAHGSGPGFCDAYWGTPGFVLVHLTREPGGSGIAIFADEIGQLPIDQAVPDAGLAVNGKKLGGSAWSVESRGKRGLFFALNPRGLMRRNPDGFAITVDRGGRRAFEADMPGAREAFAGTLECDLEAVIGWEAPG